MNQLSSLPVTSRCPLLPKAMAILLGMMYRQDGPLLNVASTNGGLFILLCNMTFQNATMVINVSCVMLQVACSVLIHVNLHTVSHSFFLSMKLYNAYFQL